VVCSRHSARNFGGGPIVAVQAIVGGVALRAVHFDYWSKTPRGLGVIAERNVRSAQASLGHLDVVDARFWTTDAIGIHSVFGGFILVLRCSRFLYGGTAETARTCAVVFLLPIFFTFSGLIPVRHGEQSQFLLIGTVVLCAAIAGKGRLAG